MYFFNIENTDGHTIMANPKNKFIDKKFIKNIADSIDGEKEAPATPEEQVKASQNFMTHLLLLKQTYEQSPENFQSFLQSLASRQGVTDDASEEEIVEFQQSVLDPRNMWLLEEQARDQALQLQQRIQQIELDELFRDANYEGVPEMSDDVRQQLKTSLMYSSEIAGWTSRGKLVAELGKYKNNFVEAMSNPMVQRGLSIAAMTASVATMNPVGIAMGLGKLLNTGPGQQFTRAIGESAEKFLIEGVGIPKQNIDNAKSWFSTKYSAIAENPVVQKLKLPITAAALIAGGTLVSGVGASELQDIVSSMGDASSESFDAAKSKWAELTSELGDVSEAMKQTSSGIPEIDASEFAHLSDDQLTLPQEQVVATADIVSNEAVQGEMQNISEPVITPETEVIFSESVNSTIVCDDTYAQAFSHEVVAGDTLSELVSEKYEQMTGEKPTNGQMWNMVYQVAEHNKIADVNLIRVGETINFPEGLEFTNEKFDPKLAMPDGTEAAYDITAKVIVEPGQTLSEITEKHYQAVTGKLPSPVLLAEMADQVGHHNHVHPHKIYPGMTIEFPSGLGVDSDMQHNNVASVSSGPDCETLNNAFHSAVVSGDDTLIKETAQYYEKLTGDSLQWSEAEKLAEYVAQHNGIADPDVIPAGTHVLFPEDLALKADEFSENKSMAERVKDIFTQNPAEDIQDHFDTYSDSYPDEEIPTGNGHRLS